jgi:D-alanyl-D-alanine carboxypeptidase/D-alanyl-D-alanine-endopeptidase (penicillin-binding protein 4)
MMHFVSAATLSFLTALIPGDDLRTLHASNLGNWIEEVTLLQPLAEPILKPTPELTAIARQYLDAIETLGFSAEDQGIWLQVGNEIVLDYEGTTALSAASLTKIATTLVSLDEWGADHRFTTTIAATGPTVDGVLQGNLVVQGGGDPFMVWEEAIAIGNALNQAGIQEVSGDLVITGPFIMNYEIDPITAGELFYQALNADLWGYEIETQYQTLPEGTARPQVAIAGTIQPATQLPSSMSPILTRESLPLSQILKSMNIYSNNIMSEVLAESLGGATLLAERAAAIAAVPSNEIQLINGSGLGEENRVSPRATVAMLQAIQRYVEPEQLNVADLFPVAGRDGGTLLDRDIPELAAVKTGTLNQVSALAGAIPTRDRGVVWFALINRGWDLDSFRQQQDILLQQVLDVWNPVLTVPIELRSDNTPNPAELLGASDRTQLMVPVVSTTAVDSSVSPALDTPSSRNPEAERSDNSALEF